jgi:hypothetical protein
MPDGSIAGATAMPPPHISGDVMKPQDFEQFDFGERTRQYIEEVMHHGGVARTEADLTEGQKVFIRAIRRERLKYTDPARRGWPETQLEQLEAFARTLGDLHHSYADAGMTKVSDCLYNRWKMVKEEVRKLAASAAAGKPAWADRIEARPADMPVFFDA